MRCVMLVAALAATVAAVAIPQDVALPDTLPFREVDDAHLEARAELSYKQKALLHHNLHRKNHTAVDVTWNSYLAKWAEGLAKQCVFAHDTTIGSDTAEFRRTNGYGQNIAAGVEESQIASTISDLWYDSEFHAFNPYWGEAQPSMENFHSWGHLTQIVWNGTLQIGCSTVLCDRIANTGGNVRPWMTVCNYSPPGNYMGQFNRNVFRPLGRPIATGSTGL